MQRITPTITMTGGSVSYDLDMEGDATITMTGGSVGNSLNAQHNATITMSGGAVKWLSGSGSPTITMSGGSVGSDLAAFNSTTITMSGGSVVALFRTYMDGTIYLNGTGFEVDGNPLVNGDKLSDFGTLFENGNTDYYTGIITGILADGSALNNEFQIYNTGTYAGTADIIVVPEPTTLLLLGFGAVLLRPRTAFKVRKP